METMHCRSSIEKLISFSFSVSFSLLPGSSLSTVLPALDAFVNAHIQMKLIKWQKRFFLRGEELFVQL